VAYFRVVSRRRHGEREEIHSPERGRNLKMVPHEHKCTAMPLHQLARLQMCVCLYVI
jgi:hypothetical protein